MPDFSVERLRNFETSDALGNGDFSVCGLAADEIERLTARLDEARKLIEYAYDELGGSWGAADDFLTADSATPRSRLAEAEKLLGAWFYWFDNANCTGIGQDTYRATDAFLAAGSTADQPVDDPEATIHKEIGISRAGRSQRNRPKRRAP